MLGAGAVCALVLAALVAWRARVPLESELRPWVIAGFLPEYRTTSRNVPMLCGRTSHLILFSIEVDGATGALTETGRLDEAFRRLPYRPRHCKAIVAVGGDGRCAGFAPMTASAKKRAVFVDALRDTYGEAADGVELNWQYPSSIQELKNLQALVREIKQSLPHWQVSMAVAPDEGFAAAIKEAGLARHFDLFHVMAYLGGNGETYDRAVAALGKVIKHLPANKTTLGIAFFGQSSDGSAYSYEDTIVHEERFTEDERRAARGVEEQVSLAFDKHLAGVSLWELGQDCRDRVEGDHLATCRGRSSLVDAVARKSWTLRGGGPELPSL